MVGRPSDPVGRITLIHVDCSLLSSSQGPISCSHKRVPNKKFKWAINGLIGKKWVHATLRNGHATLPVNNQQWEDTLQTQGILQKKGGVHRACDHAVCFLLIQKIFRERQHHFQQAAQGLSSALR